MDDGRLKDLIREHCEGILVDELVLAETEAEVVRAKADGAFGSSGASRLTATSASAACASTTTTTVTESSAASSATSALGIGAGLRPGLESALGCLGLGVLGLGHGLLPWVVALGRGPTGWGLFLFLLGALGGLWSRLLLRLLGLVALGRLIAFLVVFSFFGNLFKSFHLIVFS